MLADWTLLKPLGCFAFTDESWIEIGGTQRRQKITQPGNSNPYDYVVPLYKLLFSLTLSARVTIGYKGSLFIWEKECSEERAKNIEELWKENDDKRERIADKRRKSLVQGSMEYQELEVKNAKIREYNHIKESIAPRKRSRRPKWEFGEEKLSRSARERFDWFMYRKEVLHRLVYPFLQKVKEEKGMDIWLVEDNAGNYTQAA